MYDPSQLGIPLSARSGQWQPYIEFRTRRRAGGMHYAFPIPSSDTPVRRGSHDHGSCGHLCPFAGSD